MQSVKTLKRHQVLLRNGVVVPGASSISVGGREAEVVEVTSLTSTNREYLQGIPAPGTITCTVFHDPSNPIHKQIDQDLTAGTITTWAIRLRGSVTNGAYTNNGSDVGTFEGTIAAASGGGKAILTSPDAIGKIAPGDYVGTTGIVDSINGTQISLDPQGSTPIAAVTTARDFTIKRPAVRYEWQGFVSDFSWEGGEQNTADTASLTIQLTGAPTRKFGTPNIA